ncbi:MAG: DUF655 domain-containing protein [Desulfurococcales archaeon]|nr:DUF655 domain-containing protein [Desulfurococcales archaeon]
MTRQFRDPRRQARPEPHPAELEKTAIVLDYMPSGYYADPHREHREVPIAQAVGIRRFTLVDGIPLEEVDLMETVTLAREVPRTVVIPPGPRSSRPRRVTALLACLPGADKRIYCLPLQYKDRELVDILRMDLEAADPRIIVLDRLEALKSVASERGLPEKILVVPRKPLRFEDLSDLAKRNLEEAIARIIELREKDFVEFFNIAQPINIRLHSLALLKGVGKRTLLNFLKIRGQKRFKSFSEVKKALKTDPIEALRDKILEEIRGEAKYYLFIKPEKPDAPFLDYLDRIEKTRSRR